MLKIKLFVVVTLFIIFVVILKPSHNYEGSDDRVEKSIFLEQCEAQQKKCIFNTDKFNIEIKLDKDIYYLQKFKISVWIKENKNVNIDSVNFSFKMNEMNMGLNRFLLSKYSSDSSSDKWSADVVLPVCVSGRADWISELEVIDKKNKYRISFPVNVKIKRT